MKLGFLFGFFLLGVMATRGETVIFPIGQTNTISVNAGEVMVINQHQPSSTYTIQVSAGGITNILPIDAAVAFKEKYPLVMAGPFSLVFLPDNEHFFSYRVLTNLLIQTEILHDGATNLITIPVGKKIRFFPPIPSAGVQISVGLSIEIGQNAMALQNIQGGAEFEGPAKIRLWQKGDNNGQSAAYSYQLTDDFVSLPELGLIKGPVGAFQIAVERSNNLTNWAPVVVQATTSDQQAYYRLRILR